MEKLKLALNKIIKDLKTDTSNEAIILFGSVSRNEHHNYSDIDIYVVNNTIQDNIRKVHMYMEYDVKIHIEYITKNYYIEKHMNEKIRAFEVEYHKILFAKTSELKEELEKIKQNLPTSPPELTESQSNVTLLTVGMDRNVPKGMIEANNLCGAILYINDKLLRIANDLCSKYGWWCVDLKNMVTNMKKHNGNIGDLIEKIILEPNIYHKYDSYCELCDMVENILNKDDKNINDLWFEWY